MHNPEATAQALALLRKTDNFQWYVIFMLIVVLYLYFSEVQKKNWKAIGCALWVYAFHWFVEIINALIQHFSGHALWTAPGGTAYLLLVGVGIELSLMFAISGLAQAKLLSEDPKEKIFGIPNRLAIGIGNAALASIIEIFLVTTTIFVWVWEWWNALTVFIFVYIPFFVGGAYAYDWKPKKQQMIIGSLILINIIMLVAFAGILKWI